MIVKNTIIKVVLSISILLFGGCGYTPVPKYSFEPNDKIGYLVDISSGSVTHKHFGTTMFTNFEKKYPYEWNLNNYIERQIISTIKHKYKFDAVNLKNANFTKDDLKDLILSSGDSWMINKEHEDVYNKLKTMNLKAVIFITNGKQRYGDSKYVYDYGIFTFSSIHEISEIYTIPKPFDEKIYMIDHPADLDILASNAYDKIRNKKTMSRNFDMTVATLEVENEIDFITPKDFKNITEEEMRPFKKKLYEHFDYKIEAIGKTLHHDDRNSTKVTYDPFSETLLSSSAKVNSSVSSIGIITPKDSKKICIIQRDDIKSEFLLTYKKLLEEKGFEVEVIPHGSPMNTCKVISKYSARWSTNYSTYLSGIAISVYKDGKQISSTSFNLTPNLMNPVQEFLPSTEEKIKGMIEVLFPESNTN